MSKTTIPTITIAELKKELDAYPDHYQLSFSGLAFYRLKQRGDELVQIEFNPHVHLSEQGVVVVETPE
ncbi:MAG: hypothetical protein EPN89_03080 [Methylovulum sp.]|nr:MAG: hypothetical protein EPN89_03080 [Methylovulum sp.]